MARRTKKRLPGTELSGLRPDWRPLLDFAPDEVPDFMWMFRDFLEDGIVVEAYKHTWTRQYLHLDSSGRAYVFIGGTSYEEVDPVELLAEVLGNQSSRASIVRQNDWVDGQRIAWKRSATRHRIPRANTLFVAASATLRGSIHGGTEMAKVDEETFRTRSGSVITDEVAEELADKIESDEPVVFTGMRPVGRPSLDGNGISPRLSFRVPRELYDAAAERAIGEERTVSAVAREALEKYLQS